LGLRAFGRLDRQHAAERTQQPGGRRLQNPTSGQEK
jgi:hypothetical protein